MLRESCPTWLQDVLPVADRRLPMALAMAHLHRRHDAHIPGRLTFAYKLLYAAQARWRCVNGAHLVALVRAGATFVDGVKVEREDRRSVA